MEFVLNKRPFRETYGKITRASQQPQMTRLASISLSHDDEYPPFLGGIQFSLTNAGN
jgi:hypothetical protein